MCREICACCPEYGSENAISAPMRRAIKPTGLILLAALSALPVTACEFSPLKTTASLTYTEDAHKAYLESMRAFDAKDWEDARALFGEIRRLFAYSKYARLAELRIADIDFETAKFSDAVTGYKSFVKSNRADENIEYAKYRISKALYNEVGDSFLLAAAEEREQANARDAFEALKSFNRRFPRSRYRVDAQYMMEVVAQRLVRHELYVARYYLDRDNFEATVMRVDYALSEFPGSGLDAEAMVLKGETLLKMHKPDEARLIFKQVILQHSGPFGRVAKRFLDKMPDGDGGATEKKSEGPSG
jgi:outer membrane protein assembly factor BamD